MKRAVPALLLAAGFVILTTPHPADAVLKAVRVITSAADLSNGTTGSGAIVLATGGALTGPVTLGGNGSGMLAISNAASATQAPITVFAPSLGTGNTEYFNIGAAAATMNSGIFGFNYAGGSGSTTNYVYLGLFGGSTNLQLYGDGGLALGAPTGGDKGNNTFNLAGAVYDNGTAPTGTAGTGYVRATAPTITDAILPGFVRSTSQLDATSNTTLATVPGLSIALTAGASYTCQGHLSVTSGAAGGVKVQLVGASGLTATSSSFTGTGWNGGAGTYGRLTTTTLGVLANTAAVYSDVDITGAIVVNAAGTLNVQFAQNTSNATTSSVFTNSTFSCVRMS